MSSTDLIRVGTASALLIGAAVYLVVVLVRSRSINTPLSGNGRPLKVLLGASCVLVSLSAVATFAAEAMDAHPNWNDVVKMFLLDAAILALSATSIRLLVVARNLQAK